MPPPLHAAPLYNHSEMQAYRAFHICVYVMYVCTRARPTDANHSNRLPFFSQIVRWSLAASHKQKTFDKFSWPVSGKATKSACKAIGWFIDNGFVAAKLSALTFVEFSGSEVPQVLALSQFFFSSLSQKCDLESVFGNRMQFTEGNCPK